MQNDALTFGLWYDFRQKLPLGDHASFHAECLEEIEEGEALGLNAVWLFVPQVREAAGARS